MGVLKNTSRANSEAVLVPRIRKLLLKKLIVLFPQLKLRTAVDFSEQTIQLSWCQLRDLTLGSVSS